MADTKKFGTFAGVFTPSILTILGVIMYMRMGWVVGNAGLWGTIIIILVANVISVTTGLSISSIATDKKIGPGGVYYVLSRSLGLPIGGAIGLTLFVGTALSIALYLVGFAESFNSYLGFDAGINGLRLSGSLALWVLTAVALISTSVALKTQFFIMVAIVASLISIFFGTSDTAPQVISSFGASDGVSMEQIFAIFFPAVTGFTAGIAMSGDLKDPKKSIPSGTIAAIAVGLVVYIGLAVFLAYTVSPEVLRSDNNIMTRIALWAPAVAAGIWGATLSSAIGGILGGPRILQAMSVDRITPRLFEKGRGKDNEPWNALFLTVILAQGGILLGELDLIARVVSMFYLAAYGFINISFFLESWASSDFSPTFRVKRWVGLLGAIATFAVMFKLDMLAMLASFVIIGGIYVWLHRKQIVLGTGDIWQSVWSTLVKRGLKKLEVEDDHIRNWKPNVLLFSGGTDQRPYLLEFSRALAGNSGMTTNFDLIENTEATILFPKHKQVVKDRLLEKYGIFGRRIEVQNVFKGIENIASTFGFSGIDPNTVLMGWAKNTKNPIWFAQMTDRLMQLDYNVLYLDYDERFKFGNYKRIDIWWRSIGNNSELTLNIARFLLSSTEWRNAEVRILMVNNTLQEGFERKIHQKLDEYRIDGTVKVFNNAIEQKPFYDFLKTCSSEADLILGGIPEVIKGQEKEFVSKTNALFSIVGTTLLVKASSTLGGDQFSEVKMAVSKDAQPKLSKSHEVEVVMPTDTALAERVAALQSKLSANAKSIAGDQLRSIHNNYSALISATKQDLEETASALVDSDIVNTRMIRNAQSRLLLSMNKRLLAFEQQDIPYLSDRLNSLARVYTDFIKHAGSDLPEKILRSITVANLEPFSGDSKSEKKAKNRKRFWSKIGVSPKVSVPFKAIADYHLAMAGYQNLKGFQLKLGLATITLQMDMRTQFVECINLLEDCTDGNVSAKHRIANKMDNVQELLDEHYNYLYNYLVQSANHICKLTAADVTLVGATDLGSEMRNKNLNHEKKTEELLAFGDYWQRNQICITEMSGLDLSLHNVSYTIRKIMDALKAEIKASMFDRSATAISDAEKLVIEVETLLNGGKMNKAAEVVLELNDQLDYNDMVVRGAMSDMQNLVSKLPQYVVALDEESSNNLDSHQGAEVETFSIDIAHIADYLIDTNLQRPIEHELQTIPQTCRLVLSHALHSLRLLSFSLSAPSATTDISPIKEVLAKAKEGLAEARQELSQREQQTANSLDDMFLTAISNLNASYIIAQAEQLEEASHKNKRSNALANKWKHLLQQINIFLDKYGRLITAKRDDLLYAEFQEQNSRNKNIHATLRSYVEDVTPTRKVLSETPFYYQQLFVGKLNAKPDFLHNRERELELANDAISRLQVPGTSGGILVIGEGLSGKTFFSEIIAKEIADGKVYHIEPPVAGSIKARDLMRVVRKQIGSNDPTEEMILDAPRGSIFLFDDVELWWERSINGSEAITQLTRLIERFSGQYTFIISCNVHAFKLMRLQDHFHDHFLATIQLSPFSSRFMRKTLMTRHQTGGLNFTLNDVDETELSDRRVRKLMDNYVASSDGNIGVALHQWMANVTNVSGINLKMRPPVNLDLPTIDKHDWLVMLAQFVIHKHLTLRRIRRIFQHESQEDSLLMIQNLLRSGLIEETMGSTYRLPPYLVGPVTRTLKEYQLV